MQMKKRLISIACGLLLLTVLLWWPDTWVLNAGLTLIGCLAIYEVLRALKLNDNIVMLFVFLAAHILYVNVAVSAHYFAFFLLFAVFCLVMFSKNRHYTFKEGAAAFAAAIMISFGFRSIILMRDMSAYIWDMRFMILIALALGWICDTLAFTFGNWLGKRKMCPEISPNKTVAGGVGGVLGTPVVIAAAFYFYTTYNADSLLYGMNEPMHLLFYCGMGLVGAVVGIIGDLAASFIKRECGIKDFGSIMPGHGGALDRMDSVLFTAAFAALAFRLFFHICGVDVSA